MSELNKVKFKNAFLVCTYSSSYDAVAAKAYLEELHALAETAGLTIVGSNAVHLRQIDAATFIGSGKTQELADEARLLGADVAIFDDQISPNQQKNLEAVFGCAVVDRAGLILEIFAQRAQSREAKLQVELAQIEYMLPRLRRLWTHLSRQRGSGGSGGSAVKGEGEQQIEIDRRLLQKRMDAVRKEIAEVRQQRQIQRQARMRANVPLFAIVGYTNAGKSSLLNYLTGADVLAENKLFATLDTTVRRFELPNHQDVLLVDTVGFIRKLPHNLVAAFRSTLEESLYTDILIHVIDGSNPLAFEQAKTTFEVLKEIGATDKPMITVINKVDLLEGGEASVVKWRHTYPKTVGISVKEGTGFTELFEKMEQEVALLRKRCFLRIPQSRYNLVAFLMEHGHIHQQFYDENDILLEAELPANRAYQYESYMIEKLPDDIETSS